MEYRKQAVRTFADLDTWQEAHMLVVEIYNMTKRFPKEEVFSLVSQVRRAAVSITSNIAEGFSRSSIKDKAHFYVVAHGSLTEVQSQLYVARDVGYIDEDVFESFYARSVTVHKLLTGLIKSTKLRGDS